jgi:protocatechuate 3,4-dioxygenase beta subunit
VRAKCRPWRYGRVVRKVLHWITVSIGLLAFLLFVAQLRDSPTQSIRRHVTALEVPKSGVLRDAELSVIVVVRDSAVTSESPDAGPPKDRERLARAELHAYWQRDREFLDAGHATTNRHGEATLRALPHGVLWVLAEAPGYARTSTQLALEPGKRSVTIGLEPARSIEVTVTDEQGQPLKRATVLVTGHDPLPFGALSGDDAVARFVRLGAPPWKVKASAPGYESVTRAGVAGSLSIALRRLGALIVRVEHASGAPAVNAQVDIAGSTLWPARSVRTDARGSALIRGLLAGSFDLRATLDTEVSRTELGITLKRGEEREVVLKLQAGRFANLHVTDGEDENAPPVPDAAVVVAESGLSSFPLRGRTGRAGTVRLGPIAPGPATASASAPDFVGGSTIAIPESLDSELRIALIRGATLTGRVVDVHDHPVAGASIEIVGTDQVGLPIAETPALRALRTAHFDWSLAAGTPLLPMGELGVMPGPIPPIPGASPGVSDWVLPGTESLLGGANTSTSGLAGAMSSAHFAEFEPWVSRGDGSFRAHPVTPGRLRAIVRHPEYVEGVSESVMLAPGAEADVKVVLHEGGRLEGRVVDDRDFPVGGARVDLAALKGTTARTTVTADDGSFAFAAVPLEITLTVERPSEDTQRLAVRRTVTLREGNRETVVIVLPSARESIDVTVADEQGQPLENVELQVTSLSAEVPLKRTSFTNAEGQVTLSDARGLALRLRADLPGFVPTSQSFEAAGEALHLVLKRGVVITGRITAIRGRRNVSNAQVTVVSQGQRRTVVTDGDGRWTLRDVAPGPIHVRVEHAEFAAAESDATATATGRDDRPCEVAPIDLPDAAEVSGVVLDKNGNPAPGARVAPYPVPAYLVIGNLPSTMAVTNHEGRFALKGIGAGKLTLHAYAPSVGRGSSAPFEVIAGREARDVTIKLGPSVGDEGASASGFSLAITLAEPGTEISIASVAPGSEAERAGVMIGDTLVSIEGMHPASLADARARLSGPEGTDVLLELQRQGNSVRLRIAREPVRR